MDGASVAFSATSLLGPVGGLLGLAFGAGATAGWGFAIRTSFRTVKKQLEKVESLIEDERREAKQAIAAERDDCHRRMAALHDECNRRIHNLEARVQEVEDRYMSGMERQALQVRESSIRVIRKNRPDEEYPGEGGEP